MIYLHALNLRRRLKKTKVGWLSSGVGQNDLEEYQIVRNDKLVVEMFKAGW
jgi:hypothetical protein